MSFELKKLDTRARDLNHASTHHVVLPLTLFTDSILDLVQYICNWFLIKSIHMLLQSAWAQGFESGTFAKRVNWMFVRRGVLKLHAQFFELQTVTDMFNCLPNTILSRNKQFFNKFGFKDYLP